MNVDVTKTLPKIDFAIDGKEFTAEFYYPWLPSRCNICEKWGHNDKVCVMKKKEKKQGGLNEGNGVYGKTIVGSNSGGDRNKGGADHSIENHTREVGMYVTKSSEVSKQKEAADGQGSESAKDNVWALVSPDKVGRTTSKTPSRAVVAVISASKFSVLSVEAFRGSRVDK